MKKTFEKYAEVSVVQQPINHFSAEKNPEFPRGNDDSCSGALDHCNCCGIDVLARCLLRHESGALRHKNPLFMDGKRNPGPGHL